MHQKYTILIIIMAISSHTFGMFSTYQNSNNTSELTFIVYKYIVDLFGQKEGITEDNIQDFSVNYTINSNITSKDDINLENLRESFKQQHPQVFFSTKTKTDQDRALIRERNRLAAQRYRQRKINLVNSLREEIRSLNFTCEELKKENKSLKKMLGI